MPHAQVKPQSCGQERLVSPQVVSQNASPQMHAVQSVGQLVAFSPQPGWQAKLPHSQAKPQSNGQLVWFSLQFGSQNASPQLQGKQSCGQVNWFSPHSGWHFRLPQPQPAGQSWGQLYEVSPHWGWHCALPQ